MYFIYTLPSVEKDREKSQEESSRRIIGRAYVCWNESYSI